MADWVNDDSPWDGLGLSPEERREHDAREAVIEAAKALAARLNRDVPGFCLDEINRVADAVEALQEVEGE